jgi:tRNA A37 threonylcarbamoyladenosine synthetase subunit TsaC/SUA5/YrdC
MHPINPNQQLYFKRFGGLVIYPTDTVYGLLRYYKYENFERIAKIKGSS